jgi:hypothetical protein
MGRENLSCTYSNAIENVYAFFVPLFEKLSIVLPHTLLKITTNSMKERINAFTKPGRIDRLLPALPKDWQKVFILEMLKEVF